MKPKDKKGCGNCWNHDGCADRPLYAAETCKTKQLAKWKRDRSRWLTILPTEPGWYWHTNGNSEPYTIWIERDSATGNLVTCIDDWVKIETLGGQWQGPITPEGGRDEKEQGAK